MLTLDVVARALAARGASGARGQLGLDVLFDVGHASAGEEEDAEEHEGEVPGVKGMGDACEGCGDKSAGRKRVPGVSAIDHQPEGRRCDGGLHAWWDRSFAGVGVSEGEVKSDGKHVKRQRGGCRSSGKTRVWTLGELPELPMWEPTRPWEGDLICGPSAPEVLKPLARSSSSIHPAFGQYQLLPK